MKITRDELAEGQQVGDVLLTVIETMKKEPRFQEGDDGILPR